MSIFNLFKPKKKKTYKDQIIDTYYKDYPEIPYIAEDREKEWFGMAAMFPQSLVDRKTMIRYGDGLLPGHVYMLYWMNKYKRKNRKVPRYFEFDYGINFEKEREFLIEKGYVDENLNLTKKGENAILQHNEVVEARHPKSKNIGDPNQGIVVFSDFGRTIPASTPDGTYKVPDTDLPIIEAEIKEINLAIKKALRLAKIKPKITLDPKLIDFNCSKTCYVLHAHTAAGKKSKFPLTFHYTYDAYDPITDYEVPNDYFGEINYLKNGLIGDARLIFWKKRKGYLIKIRTKKDQTFIKSVETVNAQHDPGWVKKYVSY